MFIAFCEIVTVCWIYGGYKLARDVERVTGAAPSPYFFICWLFFAPVLVGVSGNLFYKSHCFSCFFTFFIQYKSINWSVYKSFVTDALDSGSILRGDKATTLKFVFTSSLLDVQY